MLLTYDSRGFNLGAFTVNKLLIECWQYCRLHWGQPSSGANPRSRARRRQQKARARRLWGEEEGEQKELEHQHANTVCRSKARLPLWETAREGAPAASGRTICPGRPARAHRLPIKKIFFAHLCIPTNLRPPPITITRAAWISLCVAAGNRRCTRTSHTARLQQDDKFTELYTKEDCAQYLDHVPEVFEHAGSKVNKREFLDSWERRSPTSDI